MQEPHPSSIPFLKIIIPASAGILFSRCFSIPAGAALACLSIVVLTGLLTRKNVLSGIYVWLSVFFFFLTSGTFYRPVTVLPYGERITAAVQVLETPSVRGRWRHTTAYVGFYRSGDAGGWSRAGEKIMLSVDTSFRVNVGQQMVVRGWINPVDTSGSSYGALMRLRGLHGRMYLVPGNMVCRTATVSATPGYYASMLNAAAVERLSRLHLAPDRLAVVTAMTAGDKRGIESGLRKSYSSVGAAHILAVSGLHVGIVFLLINIILYFIPVLPRGHIWKNVAAIVAVWLFAAMAGLSPSVIRAALMFSFAQLALASASYRNALNIMLASAVVMLAVNPNWAGDPSFMLSYAAVLSITVFYRPLFSLVRSRYKAVNVLTSVLIVGLVATLGTAPLVAYWFGNFPVMNLLINPVIIFTAHITVMAGVLWIVMPFEFLNPVLSGLLSFSSGLQNRVVEWSAGVPWASIEVRLPLLGVILIYAVLFLAGTYFYRKRTDTGNRSL